MGLIHQKEKALLHRDERLTKSTNLSGLTAWPFLSIEGIYKAMGHASRGIMTILNIPIIALPETIQQDYWTAQWQDIDKQLSLLVEESA